MKITDKNNLSSRAQNFLFALKRMQIGNPQLFRQNVQIPISLWPKAPVESLHDKWFYETLFYIATVFITKTGYKCACIAGEDKETCFVTFDEIDFIRKELAERP